MSTEEIRKEIDGTSWLASIFSETIAGGTSFYGAILTGDVPIILKTRTAITDSTEFLIALYEDVIYTGGTLFPGARNKNRIVGDSNPSFQLLIDIVPDPVPIPESEAISVIGLNSALFESVTTVSQGMPDNAFLLKPNSTYVVEFQNTDLTGRELTYVVSLEELKGGVPNA